jgi:hypothetical protein
VAVPWAMMQGEDNKCQIFFVNPMEFFAQATSLVLFKHVVVISGKWLGYVSRFIWLLLVLVRIF